MQLKMDHIAKNKITALYVRVSKDDVDKKDESNSVTNQKALLKKVAKEKGLKNTRFFVDDGLSGVFFDKSRPAFVEMMGLVQSEEVGAVIVKDLSRLGRNYKEAGEYTETIFPYYNIRFIAIGDGIDKENKPQRNRINGGLDIIVAFKNLMNEGYVQDLSNKLRLAQATKSSMGYAIGHPPYGYIYDTKDPKRWAIDPESADIVRYIYRLRLEEKLSAEKIAERLRREKVYTPSVYYEKKGIKTPKIRNTRGEYFWSINVVRKILMNQSYVGDVINFKTYTNSYKDKQQHINPVENQDIHFDVHEAIISRDDYHAVAASFRINYTKPKETVKHPLAGYLFCADCGKKLHYKLTYPNHDNQYFSCGNNRTSKVLCPKSHHIRVDVIEQILLREINKITWFAKSYEDEFVKIVVSSHYKKAKMKQDKDKQKLSQLKSRSHEVDILIQKILEKNVLGDLSDERYKILSQSYEDEQLTIKQQIHHLQKIVDDDTMNELDVNSFLSIAKRYTNIVELTPKVIREFITKVIVHHRENEKQEIEIYFNLVGKVEIPSVDEKQSYFKNFEIKKENQIAS